MNFTGRDGRSQTSTRHASRKLLPSIDSLETRKMLSTATASAGAFSVSVETRLFSATDIDVYANLYRNGSLVRGSIPVATTGRFETAPTVSINANGRFAVSYVDKVSAVDDNIVLRVYNGSGDAVTSSMTVDTSTQRESDPDVSINGSGRIVVAYTQEYTPTDLNVKAVQYTPNNTTGSSNTKTFYVVSNETNRNEFNPYVTVAQNGDWAISYNRNYSTSDTDVYAVVKRATDISITQRVPIATTSANEDLSAIASFIGGNSLTVSYRRGLGRFQRSVTV